MKFTAATLVLASLTAARSSGPICIDNEDLATRIRAVQFIPDNSGYEDYDEFRSNLARHLHDDGVIASTKGETARAKELYELAGWVKSTIGQT